MKITDQLPAPRIIIYPDGSRHIQREDPATHEYEDITSIVQEFRTKEGETTSTDEVVDAEDKTKAVPRAEDSLADRLLWLFIVKLPALLLIFFVALYFTGRLTLATYSVGNHGETLDEFITNAHNEPYEIHATFDANGTKYYETTQYDHGSVRYDTNSNVINWVTSLGNYTSAHTHPRDYPFSLMDLGELSEASGAARHMVISPNFVYTLEAPNGWPGESILCEYLDQVRIDIQNHAEYTKHLFITEFTSDGRIGAASTDTFLEKFATDFDLVYTVTPIDEWNQT